MHPGKRALTEKAMQHRSPVRYRLDHREQLLGVVVMAVCIRARWVIHTSMSVHCCTGLGYTPGYTVDIQWSKSRVRPVAHWAEKLDRVINYRVCQFAWWVRFHKLKRQMKIFTVLCVYWSAKNRS